ncbi:MAG: hypothetical protein AB7R40_21685 [Nitrospiraceae bacterium]
MMSSANRRPRRNLPAFLAYTLVFSSVYLSYDARADTEDKKWSVSPLLGVHKPRMTLLNKGEFRSPLPGRGRIIFQDSGENTDYDFVINNQLPEVEYGTEAGVELRFNLDPAVSLILGASGWEGVSTSAVQTEIPFQGTLTPAGYERSASISYFQYYLGLQRILLQKPKKYDIYGRITLNEVLDIDYKENLVFGFQGVGGDTFKRIIEMESQATGLLMLNFGVGGEYFLKSWISLGLDLGYTLSAEKISLGNATLKSDIQEEDNLNFRTPVQLDTSNELTYLSDATTFDDVSYRKLELGFDGWRALFRINMYF